MESQAPYGHALRTSCDKCRSAKVKCQREGQSCSRCVQRDEECTTTFLPRKVPKPDRRGRILHMESRIERMESILAASGLADEVATTPATTGSPTTDLDDRLSMLLLHDEGNSTFIGTASNLSLFSPAGLNWITNRTNCSDLSDLVKKRAQEISIFKETCLYPSHVHRGQAPLPPKNVADPLISCYFDTLNSVIPLFRRDKFEQLYVQQYSNNPPKSTSWYASFNVILALGGLLSLDEDIYAISEGSTRTYTAALDYIRNSWHVFTELSLNCRDFMTIQALITMGLTMDILLDKDAAYIAIGAAARVATSIGLQQQVKDLRLSPPEISERYIVFWCLYSFDKTLSLRLGRPPAIDDRDTEIDIPDEKQLTLENPRSITVLLSHMRLGRITSEVYSELYSARSRKYPAIKRFRTISELDRKLQDWCMSLPADIRPGSQISCSEGALRSVFTLHLEYYNCLATLHRCWAFQDPLAEYEELRNDLAHRGCGDIGDRVYSGQLICLDAARSTADLLTVLGQHGLQDSALIGLTLYHSLSAFIILFANILQNPGDSYVSKDVQLLSVIIDSLCPGLQASGAALPNLAYELLEKMRSVAVEYVARVHTNVKAAPKRPYEQTEGAVKRHPIRSAQDNHNQPPDYRQASSNYSYGTNSEYSAYPNSTQASGSMVTGLPHELASGAYFHNWLGDQNNDLTAEEVSPEQSFSQGDYGMESFAESFPGPGPFIPWNLDLDLINLWQYGSQNQFGGEGFHGVSENN